MKRVHRIIAVTGFLACLAAGEDIKEPNDMKQYFKSWASYHIPMRPIDPIEYGATETLKAFYLGEFDAGDTLIRFTKYLRDARGTTRVTLPPSNSPMNQRYLSAVKEQEQLRPGSEILYQETEGKSHYFRVVSIESGNVAKLELIHTSVFFVDEYSYWPNKQLKTRTTTKSDGTVLRTSFDESGKETGKK